MTLLYEVVTDCEIGKDVLAEVPGHRWVISARLRLKVDNVTCHMQCNGTMSRRDGILGALRNCAYQCMDCG